MSNEELVMEIRRGSKELLHQLWQQCYGFVRQQAVRWAKAWENCPAFDTEDFIQSGYIALCKAAEGFEAKRGSSFISYLGFCLKTEFSKVAGCRTARQQNDLINMAFSFELPIYGDGGGEEKKLGDTIKDPVDFALEVEEKIFSEQVSNAVRKAVDELPDQQRKAIEGHYLQGQTYAEIASQINCSGSYVGQLVKSGLRGMREGKHASDLRVMYGERNFYRGTGLATFKRTGFSSPEWEVIWMESRENSYIK